jgi:hypothetical protein
LTERVVAPTLLYAEPELDNNPAPMVSDAFPPMIVSSPDDPYLEYIFPSDLAYIETRLSPGAFCVLTVANFRFVPIIREVVLIGMLLSYRKTF